MPYFSLNTKKDGSNPSRFCFVVGKKTARRAVDRNLIKRRGRAVIIKHKSGIISGYSGMFYARKGAETAIFSEIEECILRLLKNAGMLIQT